MPEGSTQQDQSAAGTPAAGATGEAGQRTQPGFVGSSTGQPIAKPPEGAAAGGDSSQQQLPLAGSNGAPKPPEGGEPPPPAEGERGVVGHGGGEMPPLAISERLARERRKWLRDEYGTDDDKEIVRIKQERKDAAEARAKEVEELEQYRAQAEAKRREDMTELERAKSDLAAKDRELEAKDQELTEIRNDTLAEKQEAVVTRVFTGHLADKFHAYAKHNLARHFRELTPEEQAGFDERKLDRWTRGFVKDNLEMARPTDSPAVVGDAKPPAAKPAPRRSPVSTSKVAPGTASPKPAPAAGPGEVAGKTVKPGQANSMNKSELNEHFQQTYGRKKPW